MELVRAGRASGLYGGISAGAYGTGGSGNDVYGNGVGSNGGYGCGFNTPFGAGSSLKASGIPSSMHPVGVVALRLPFPGAPAPHMRSARS